MIRSRCLCSHARVREPGAALEQGVSRLRVRVEAILSFLGLRLVTARVAFPDVCDRERVNACLLDKPDQNKTYSQGGEHAL